MKAIPAIKKSDCRFSINKDARTIVCVIPHTTDMLYDFLTQNFQSRDFDIISTALDWSMMIMPKSFSGKATCAEEDEWDEELGKNIAYARARRKLYHSFFRRANHIVNTIDLQLNNMVFTLNTLGDKVTRWQDNLEQDIDKKISGEA